MCVGFCSSVLSPSKCTCTYSLIRHYGHFRYHLPPNFYALYLISLCYRLDKSFKGSFLEVSRCTINTLYALVLFIPFSANIILIIDDNDGLCSAIWNPPDIALRIRSCFIPPSSLLAFKTHLFEICVLLIISLNATFAIILTVKLRKFMALHTNDAGGDGIVQKKKTKLLPVITKNAILTVVGCISTICGQFLWALAGNLTFYLFTDLLINSVIVGLMFQWNDRYFRWFCGLCIRLCPHSKGEEKNLKMAGTVHSNAVVRTSISTLTSSCDSTKKTKVGQDIEIKTTSPPL